MKKRLLSLLLIVTSWVFAGNSIHISKYPRSTQSIEEEFYLDVSGSFPYDCYNQIELTSLTDNNEITELNIHYPYAESGPCVDGVILPVTVPFRNVIKVREEFDLPDLPFAMSLSVSVSIELPLFELMFQQKEFNFDSIGSSPTLHHIQPGLWSGVETGSKKGLYLDQINQSLIINPMGYDYEGKTSWQMAVESLSDEIATGSMLTYERTFCEFTDYNCEIEVVDSQPFDLIIEGHNQVLLKVGDSDFKTYNTLAFGSNAVEAAFSSLVGNWVVRIKNSKTHFEEVAISYEGQQDYGYSVYKLTPTAHDSGVQLPLTEYMICDAYRSACIFTDTPNQEIDQCFELALLVRDISRQFLSTTSGSCENALGSEEYKIDFYRVVIEQTP